MTTLTPVLSLFRTPELLDKSAERERVFSQAGVPWHDYGAEVFVGEESGLAEGEFRAIVSVFEKPDRPDFFGDVDIIHRGAFADVIEAAEAGKPWPVVWTHEWGIPPLGPTLKARERREGLEVHGKMRLADPGVSGDFARSIHQAMQDRSLRAFSFAFIPDEKTTELEETGEGPFGPTFTRHIHRISEVFEVGPTLVGRHPATRLIGVKSHAVAPSGKPPSQVLLKHDELVAMTGRGAPSGKPPSQVLLKHDELVAMTGRGVRLLLHRNA